MIQMVLAQHSEKSKIQNSFLVSYKVTDNLAVHNWGIETLGFPILGTVFQNEAPPTEYFLKLSVFYSAELIRAYLVIYFLLLLYLQMKYTRKDCQGGVYIPTG